jgi:hypothetical protein
MQYAQRKLQRSVTETLIFRMTLPNESTRGGRLDDDPASVWSACTELCDESP